MSNKELRPQAIDIFNRALQLKPDHQAAFFQRGACYFCQKKYKEALADLTESLRLAPNDYGCLFYRGRTYHMLGEPQKAIADLQLAVAHKRKNGHAAFDHLARVYFGLNDMANAIKYWDEALMLKPDYATAKTARDLALQISTAFQSGMNEIAKKDLDWDKALPISRVSSRSNLITSKPSTKKGFA